MSKFFEKDSISTQNSDEKIEKNSIENSREDEILNCLEEFQKCAVFCTSDKPPKRQKRNDYESSNSGKQTVDK